MMRTCMATGLLALFLLSSSLIGDDKKDETKKEETPKTKGYLPMNWKQLGLTDEQKQKIYTTQDKYRSKVDALEKQIKEFKAQEREELEKVLTDAQKARLREILLDKAPKDKKAPDKTENKDK